LLHVCGVERRECQPPGSSPITVTRGGLNVRDLERMKFARSVVYRNAAILALRIASRRGTSSSRIGTRFDATATHHVTLYVSCTFRFSRETVELIFGLDSSGTSCGAAPAADCPRDDHPIRTHLGRRRTRPTRDRSTHHSPERSLGFVATFRSICSSLRSAHE